MPITINGTGSITGVTAGGLPSGSVTTANIADANITAAKLDGAQSGSAPIYGCRAWVNFDGTSGSIGSGRANGNVSSVTDMGTGDYIINFTTAMQDTNFVVVGAGGNTGVGYGAYFVDYSPTHARSTGSVRIWTGSAASLQDTSYVNVAIFR